MYDEKTSKGYIRRWSLVGVEPRAVADAIPIDHPDVAAVVGRNVAIWDLIAAAEAYLEGLAMPTPNLNRQRQTIDQDGYHYEPEPAWLAYDELQEALANAPDIVKAFAMLQAPHVPEEDPDIEAAALAEREAAEEMVQAHIDTAPAIAPLLPVPELVSDRQFFHAAALMGILTPAEALAAVKTGEIPAMLEQIISGLPEGPQFDARMVLSGAVEFRRDHPLVGAIAYTLGWSEGNVDDLYRLAGSLQ